MLGFKNGSVTTGSPWKKVFSQFMVWLVVAIKLNRKQKVGDQEVKHLKLKMLLIIWKLNLLNIKFADAKKFIDYTL